MVYFDGIIVLYTLFIDNVKNELVPN